jgi:hypothetical protein
MRISNLLVSDKKASDPIDIAISYRVEDDHTPHHHHRKKNSLGMEI